MCPSCIEPLVDVVKHVFISSRFAFVSAAEPQYNFNLNKNKDLVSIILMFAKYPKDTLLDISFQMKYTIS